MKSRRDTIRSFQDLDATRFHDSDGASPRAPDASASVPGKKATPPSPPLEDEAALFLAAVSGNVDVSKKNPAADNHRTRDDAADAALFMNAAGQSQGTRPDSHALRDSPVPPALAPCEPEEENLFADAMNDVTPIRARGRDLAPASRPVEERAPYTGIMDDIVAGKVEFSLEYTDEFFQGHVLGLDPIILAKLRAGAFSPEGHVDLHGKNMEQAYPALAAFVKHAYLAGKRHLLVITGRGKNSPGGTPVLRERVQAWLTRDPFKRVVLGFCTAKPGDGGAGALYVLLRKRKKSQGKIVWDRMPTEEELFF